jgi:hypothetical protein
MAWPDLHANGDHKLHLPTFLLRHHQGTGHPALTPSAQHNNLGQLGPSDHLIHRTATIEHGLVTAFGALTNAHAFLDMNNTTLHVHHLLAQLANATNHLNDNTNFFVTNNPDWVINHIVWTIMAFGILHLAWRLLPHATGLPLVHIQSSSAPPTAVTMSHPHDTYENIRHDLAIRPSPPHFYAHPTPRWILAGYKQTSSDLDITSYRPSTTTHRPSPLPHVLFISTSTTPPPFISPTT